MPLFSRAPPLSIVADSAAPRPLLASLPWRFAAAAAANAAIPALRPLTPALPPSVARPALLALALALAANALLNLASLASSSSASRPSHNPSLAPLADALFLDIIAYESIMRFHRLSHSLPSSHLGSLDGDFLWAAVLHFNPPALLVPLMLLKWLHIISVLANLAVSLAAISSPTIISLSDSLPKLVLWLRRFHLLYSLAFRIPFPWLLWFPDAIVLCAAILVYIFCVPASHPLPIPDPALSSSRRRRHRRHRHHPRSQQHHPLLQLPGTSLENNPTLEHAPPPTDPIPDATLDSLPARIHSTLDTSLALSHSQSPSDSTLDSTAKQHALSSLSLDDGLHLKNLDGGSHSDNHSPDFDLDLHHHNHEPTSSSSSTNPQHIPTPAPAQHHTLSSSSSSSLSAAETHHHHSTVPATHESNTPESLVDPSTTFHLRQRRQQDPSSSTSLHPESHTTSDASDSNTSPTRHFSTTRRGTRAETMSAASKAAVQAASRAVRGVTERVEQFRGALATPALVTRAVDNVFATRVSISTTPSVVPPSISVHSSSDPNATQSVLSPVTSASVLSVSESVSSLCSTCSDIHGDNRSRSVSGDVTTSSITETVGVATSTTSSPSPQLHGDVDGNGWRDAASLPCTICHTRTRDTILEPCRHLCICGDCRDVMMVDRGQVSCPVCLRGVESSVRVYWS